MAGYLKYVLENIEPVRIADDSISQSGQTLTLRYIPGSTIRGIIIGRLAKEADFENIKKKLFSREIRYLNAYPSVTEEQTHHELFPSPKGFYEDKAEKELINVVAGGGDPPEGMKRAKLGRFARFEDHKICYYNVDTGSDIKILSNVSRQTDRNMFRNEYICPGTEFTGYILVEDPALQERMKKILSGIISVGNARTAGYGKCRVHSAPCEKMPFGQDAETAELPGECYMMLLSDTVMRNELGELCGLDQKALEREMKVSNLELVSCATSTVHVKGYNRKWESKIPSAVMYEAGSVFRFRYNGILKATEMKRISREGIGIRTNEGFGQVIFLKGYPDIQAKRRIEPQKKQAETPSLLELSSGEKKTLKLIAKAYYRKQLDEAMRKYIVEHPLPRGSESNSRLGILQAYITSYRYDPDAAARLIEDYYRHAEEKEKGRSVQKEYASIQKIKAHVQKILAEGLDLEVFLAAATCGKTHIMQFPKAELLSKEEKSRLKLEFLLKELRYENKNEEV